MMKGIWPIIALVFLATKITCIHAQPASSSENLVAHPIPDRTVSFNISDTGTYKPVIWGLDLAWLNKGNILRGIAFMGANRVDIIRSSFTPTAPLVNGELQAEELGRLNERLDIIDIFGRSFDVSTLPSGMYILNVANNENSLIKKFIIKH